MNAISEPQAFDAVDNLMIRLREAWNNGDGEAYAAVFSEDAQYVTAPGERLHGRKQIAESHQKVFDTIFKGTTIGRKYPRMVRAITQDVILIEAAGSVLFPGEVEDNIPPNGLMTLLVARQEDTWRIVSFQNTPTGKHRKVKFMARYLISRLSSPRAK